LGGTEQDKSIWNMEYIRALFLSGGLNVTALNNYVTCPMKYFYRNLVRLPSEYSTTLIFGNTVHKALEVFFSDSKTAEKILDSEHLVSIFQKYLSETGMTDRDHKTYLDRGVKLLSEYYNEYHSDWTYRIAIEQNVKKTITLTDGTELKLSGKLDKIEFLDSELEGKINLIDYKTGKTYSQKDRHAKESLDRQIIFYHVLLDGYHDGKFIINDAVLDFVEKNKDKGVYEQKRLLVTDKNKEDLLDLINSVSSEIQSGEFLTKGCKKKECEFCALSKK